MAIVTNKQYSGQRKTDVLSGGLRIEEGDNRLVVFDGTVNRMLIGVDPNTGNVIIAISKPGEDVFDALAA